MKRFLFFVVAICQLLKASEHSKSSNLGAQDGARSKKVIVSPRSSAPHISGSAPAAASARASKAHPRLGAIVKHASLANVLGKGTIDRLNATGDPNKDTAREDEFNKEEGSKRLGLSDLQPPAGYVNRGSTRFRSGTAVAGNMRGIRPSGSFNPAIVVGAANRSSLGGNASAGAKTNAERAKAPGSGRGVRGTRLVISAARSQHADDVTTPSGVLMIGPSVSASDSTVAHSVAIGATGKTGAITPRSPGKAASSGNLTAKEVSDGQPFAPSSNGGVCGLPPSTPSNNHGAAPAPAMLPSSSGSTPVVGQQQSGTAAATVGAAQAHSATQPKGFWATVKSLCCCCCCCC